jgi:glycosyltransferase involved in cell wall biosynthesis
MGSGGAERVAATLANAWSVRGNVVKILATYSGRGDCFYALRAEVAMQYLADEVEVRPDVSKRYFRRLLALRRAIGTFHPDVIVSFLANVNVAAIMANTGGSVPLVISERIDPFVMPRPPALRAMCRLLYGFAEALVVQTDEVAAKFVQTGYAASRIAVIPNPVSREFIRVARSRQPDGRFRLLSVGRLDDQKQFELLLEMFAALSGEFPEWTLRVVGEGPRREHLRSLVDRYGLAGRVELQGQVTDVAREYEQADLFVLTSRYEGFPNAMLEAMATGLPCITFDCPSGPREISENGKVAILVNAGDRRGFEDALRRLMSSPELRESLGSDARRSVTARFAEDAIVPIWDSLFDRLTRRNDHGKP